MTRDGTPAALRRTLPTSLIAAALVVAGAVAVHNLRVKGATRSAIVRWRPQIEAMLGGEDAYTRFGFPTPPVMALILLPFVTSVYPIAIGMTAWVMVKAVLTLAALHGLVLQQ